MQIRSKLAVMAVAVHVADGAAARLRRGREHLIQIMEAVKML